MVRVLHNADVGREDLMKVERKTAFLVFLSSSSMAPSGRLRRLHMAPPTLASWHACDLSVKGEQARMQVWGGLRVFEFSKNLECHVGAIAAPF